MSVDVASLRARIAAPVPTPADVRSEVLALLRAPEADAAWQAYHAGEEPDPRALYALLGVHRLLAPAWPIPYGGRGLTPHHQAAVVHALVEAGISETLHTLSIQIAGGFLLGAATRAQRALLLPDLAAGRAFATILYSEPDVGSDLAALTTSASRDPAGGWRVTGRKVYSVKSWCADVGLVAARTSDEPSRYQGISLLCVPMNAPGVDVRALPSMADEQFADVNLDGVWVSEESVIGPVGKAWPLITDALALERTGVDYHAKAARWLALWREYADVIHGGPDPSQRIELARLSAKVEAAGRFADRCLNQLAGGHVDPVLAATTKLWCADTAREVAWWCTEESGADVLRRPTSAATDPIAPGGGRIESAYREAPGLTISAGTAEMMLEVVAGSGLPSPGGDLVGFDEEPLARAVRDAARDIAAAYDEHHDVDAWWAELVRIDAFGLDVPAADGGLGLGLAASTIVCEELGRGLLDAGVLDTLTAVDAHVADPRRPSEPLTAAMTGRYRAVIIDNGRSLPGRRPSLAVWPDRVDEVLVLQPVPTFFPAGPATAVPTCSDAPLSRVPAPSGPGLPLTIAAARLIERDRTRRAAWLVGLATGALGEAVRRVRDRHQFGRALIEHQAIAFTLARLTARVAAARLLVTAATEHGDSTTRAGTRALATAVETAYAVTRESMQVCGAWGMTAEAPAQRFYRAAMVACGLAGPIRRLWREVDLDPDPHPASDSTKGAEHVR